MGASLWLAGCSLNVSISIGIFIPIESGPSHSRSFQVAGIILHSLVVPTPIDAGANIKKGALACVGGVLSQ